MGFAGECSWVAVTRTRLRKAGHHGMLSQDNTMYVSTGAKRERSMKRCFFWSSTVIQLSQTCRCVFVLQMCTNSFAPAVDRALSSASHLPVRAITAADALYSIDVKRPYSLWSPYVIGQTIIFSCCFFFLSSFLISSPNLSGRRLDV